jgi:hypothetical protein
MLAHFVDSQVLDEYYKFKIRGKDGKWILLLVFIPTILSQYGVTILTCPLCVCDWGLIACSTSTHLKERVLALFFLQKAFSNSVISVTLLFITCLLVWLYRSIILPVIFTEYEARSLKLREDAEDDVWTKEGEIRRRLEKVIRFTICIHHQMLLG